MVEKGIFFGFVSKTNLQFFKIRILIFCWWLGGLGYTFFGYGSKTKFVKKSSGVGLSWAVTTKIRAKSS